MTPSHLTTWLTAGASALALLGCAGLETGNGEQPTTVTFKVGLTSAEYNADEQPIAKDAQGEAFAIQAAAASVAWIDLTLPPQTDCDEVADAAPPGQVGDTRWTVTCETPSTLRFHGPWIVNLTTGAFAPTLDPALVPPGLYTRAEVRFVPGDPGGGAVETGDPMEDVTLSATGEFALDGTPTPFAMALKFTDSALFELPAGLTLEAGLAHELLLLLDVTAWFADLPIADCANKGSLALDGATLVLGEGKDKCQGVEQAITSAIKGSAKLDRALDRKP